MALTLKYSFVSPTPLTFEAKTEKNEDILPRLSQVL